jgi:hypothetical protein
MSLKQVASIAKLISCLANTSTLKMEATPSSEVPVDFQRTTEHHIAEDGTYHWGFTFDIQMKV